MLNVNIMNICVLKGQLLVAHLSPVPKSLCNCCSCRLWTPLLATGLIIKSQGLRRPEQGHYDTFQEGHCSTYFPNTYVDIVRDFLNLKEFDLRFILQQPNMASGETFYIYLPNELRSTWTYFRYIRYIR